MGKRSGQAQDVSEPSQSSASISHDVGRSWQVELLRPDGQRVRAVFSEHLVLHTMRCARCADFAAHEGILDQVRAWGHGLVAHGDDCAWCAEIRELCES